MRVTAITNDRLPITKIKWFRHQIKVWAKQHSRDFPWRCTKDPYSILVAEFLLQKTSAATVAPVYQRFIDRYPTLNALAAAPVEDVTMLLQPLGVSFRVRNCFSVIPASLPQNHTQPIHPIYPR